LGFLKTPGFSTLALHERRQSSERIVSILPGCHQPTEFPVGQDASHPRAERGVHNEDQTSAGDDEVESVRKDRQVAGEDESRGTEKQSNGVEHLA